MKRWKEILLFVLYIIFIVIQNSHHELWRDEIHSWYIVQSSNTLLELWHNVDYEGHPIGWYFILFIAKQFYANIEVQNIVHLIFTFGLGFLLIFKSPFSFGFKVLLLFGYFFGYEYAILQRNYTPALFLITLSLILYLQKVRHLPYILLLLAGFINIHAFIIACLLYVYFLWKEDQLKSYKTITIHTLILLCYAALFYIDIKPNATNVDMHYDLQWTWSQLHIQLLAFSEGLLKPSFILGTLGLNNLFFSMVIFLSIALIPLFIFRKDKKTAALWLFNCLGFFVFWFLLFKPYIRHSGHIWFMLLVCSWLYLREHKADKKIYFLLYPIALFHIALGCKIMLYDWKQPVSQIEHVTSYLKEKDLTQYELVGYVDYCASPIGCLLKKKMYYPQSPNRTDFIQYTKERIVGFNDLELAHFSDSLGQALNKKVILIANRPQAKLADKKMASFKNEATREEENFYLYLFNKL